MNTESRGDETHHMPIKWPGNKRERDQGSMMKQYVGVPKKN